MASKEEITGFFNGKFREFKSSFDQVLQKITSIVLLQMYLDSR